jgi:hypothetical protein
MITDYIGAALGIMLCLFLFSPVVLVIYMLVNSKIDVDGDGKGDI